MLVSESRLCFVEETAQQHLSETMQTYVTAQQKRGDRQWVAEVLQGSREADTVLLRTREFVLLPDTSASTTKLLPTRLPPKTDLSTALSTALSTGNTKRLPAHEWLCIVTDKDIHNLRDLRAEHVPMLQRMHTACLTAISLQCDNMHSSELVAFVNYPPSVHTLHVHFCAPFRMCMPYDAFRMHSMQSIIANLRMDSEYYAKCSLHFPVMIDSEIHRILRPPQHRPQHPLRRAFAVWHVSSRAVPALLACEL